MNIVIFGASGATGHELVKQALAQGHNVTAFVRNPSKLQLQHDQLNFIQGNVTDYASIERAIQGQDAVFCALGASSPLRRDPALIKGVGNITVAMKRHRVNRFIYLSFLGVKEGRKGLGFFVKYIVVQLLRNVVADHEDKERIVKNSNLDWTIVRPPRLTNGPHTGGYRSGETIDQRSFILTISRADLADFMLKQLSDTSNVGKAPRVMY
ncbi:Putative NADH-flavin reductase [Seinonella peptonophila]|uniref:Putative NADH-flavin reductase n=1 Tax=Seinonella peptonophila TaxID=112248 RepID=A0A1M4WHQ3_9BACL|nr:SDR family oxidoreductase [Seinonella peptonophila]SHE80502.1 Putative NADH-flavin reductase [Seinonella peptonophila]